MGNFAPHEGLLQPSYSHAQAAWLFSYLTGKRLSRDVVQGHRIGDGVYNLRLKVYSQRHHEP